MTNENLKLLEAILQEGHQALKPLYQEIKPAFLKYMQRYTPDPDIRLDAFHEAMLAFYEYCLAGKYNPDRSAPKTMVFMMGRAYLINRLKLEQRNLYQETETIDSYIKYRVTQQYHSSLSEAEILVRDAILKLGDKCRQLLQLFFYRNYSIEAIMENMKYKNENVVSSHKSRCIKQLKEILQAKS